MHAVVVVGDLVGDGVRAIIHGREAETAAARTVAVRTNVRNAQRRDYLAITGHDAPVLRMTVVGAHIRERSVERHQVTFVDRLIRPRVDYRISVMDGDSGGLAAAA